MSQWQNLKTEFDERLPRRTSVLLKENPETSAYYYPIDFGKVGYQVDTREESTYEEKADFSFYIDDMVLGDLLNHDVWTKQSFYFTKMESKPNWIERSVSYINSGLDLVETFTSPNDSGVTWKLNYKQRCLHHELKRTFLLVISSQTNMHVLTEDTEKNLVLTISNNSGNTIYLASSVNQPFGLYSSMDQCYNEYHQLAGAIRHDLGRYLVLPVTVSFPSVSSSNDFDEMTSLFSMSTLGKKQAIENYLINADTYCEKRWNAFFDKLPPIETNDQEVLTAYHKCWYVIRQNYFNHPEWGKIILEALPVYKGVWTWGTSALLYSALLNPDDGPERAKNALDLLLTNIREDGYIPHAIYVNEEIPGQKWNKGTGIIQTPHLPWVVLAYYDKTKDKATLEKWYKPLVQFYQYICKSRDENHDNLHLWAAKTSFDTGIDVYPNFSDITYEDEDYVYPAVFAAERCRYENSMSTISSILGRHEEANHWKIEMEQTLQAANNYLWDAEKGWYGVRHQNGQIETIVGIDGLFFLSYGLVSVQRANQMKHNFKSLIGKYGIHTVSPQEQKYEGNFYWRGPAWAKSCALGVQAAHLYYKDLLPEMRESILSFIMRWPSIWECMNAESGQIARGDIGVFATPFIASNVGAGELLGALLTFSHWQCESVKKLKN